MGNVSATVGVAEEHAINSPKSYVFTEVKECPSSVGPENPADVLYEKGFEFRRVTCDSEGAVIDDGDADDASAVTLTRLFHIVTGLMVTKENRTDLVRDGKTWDEISSLCQHMAQEQMVKEYALHRVILETEDEEPTSDESQSDDEREEEPKPKTQALPIYALVDRPDPPADSDPFAHGHPRELRPTLVVIPGMGKSRAGILSVKELMESGLEVGSAAAHVQQARERDWRVLLLDPNAAGVAKGLQTVAHSLRQLVRAQDEGPVYVLAHSAAGGYLVRYLLDDADPGARALRKRLAGIVFSDSTHNLQWARLKETECEQVKALLAEPQASPVAESLRSRLSWGSSSSREEESQDENSKAMGMDGSSVFDFLQSPHCLYIRNNTVHSSEFKCDDSYTTGEACIPDDFWTHRYGSIPTVWAGTTEHSLVCYVARRVVWDFWDERVAKARQKAETETAEGAKGDEEANDDPEDAAEEEGAKDEEAKDEEVKDDTKEGEKEEEKEDTKEEEAKDGTGDEGTDK